MENFRKVPLFTDTFIYSITHRFDNVEQESQTFQISAGLVTGRRKTYCEGFYSQSADLFAVELLLSR